MPLFSCHACNPKQQWNIPKFVFSNSLHNSCFGSSITYVSLTIMMRFSTSKTTFTIPFSHFISIYKLGSFGVLLDPFAWNWSSILYLHTNRGFCLSTNNAFFNVQARCFFFSSRQTKLLECIYLSHRYKGFFKINSLFLSKAFSYLP